MYSFEPSWFVVQCVCIAWCAHTLKRRCSLREEVEFLGGVYFGTESSTRRGFVTAQSWPFSGLRFGYEMESEQFSLNADRDKYNFSVDVSASFCPPSNLDV